MSGRCGTHSSYKSGCHCDECRAVNTAYQQSNGTHTASGRLLVECWCMGDMLLVSKASLDAGYTASCGRPDCRI